MYELLKADSKIRISEELVDNFKEINASLAEACGLALRQPIAGKQYVLMTDASFRASGYALMIEENDERKNTLQTENLRTSSVRITSFFTCTTENVHLLQGILGNLPRLP